MKRREITRGIFSSGLALLALTVAAGSAQGATYYVSPSGADANPCSLALPCREINRGLELAVAGDVIEVANGTYQGFSVISKVGAVGSPITIYAPGGLADITADADDSIFVQLSSYIELDGLRAFGAGRHAVRISQSDHITVRNGVFADSAAVIAGNGINVSRSDDVVLEDNECSGSLLLRHGISIENSSDRPVIRRNRIHDNTGSGINMNADLSFGGDGIISGAVIEANVIYGNNLGDVATAGISMDGVVDTIVRNNLFYGNRGYGLNVLQGDGAVGPQGLQILNNTIDMPANGRNGFSLRHSTGPSTLRNNIVIVRDATKSAIRFGNSTDVDNIAPNSDYNVLDRLENETASVTYSLAAWQANFGYELNSLSAGASSLWVDAAAADYHLSPTSPARDEGQTQVLVPTDIEAVQRPQGSAWDIGAYEWAALISVDDVAIVEGFGGTAEAIFTVSLSGALPVVASVDWSTADGTATSPDDYTAASDTLTFTPGQTSKTVAVTVRGDLDDESDETFFLNLSNPTGALIDDGQGVGTIIDDDPLTPASFATFAMLGQARQATLPLVDPARWFKVRLVAGRSYAASAWAPGTDPSESPVNLDLAWFLEDGVTAADGATVSVMEPAPEASQHSGAAASIIPTSAQCGAATGCTYRLRLQATGAVSAIPVKLMVVETTLISPHWQVVVGAGYDSAPQIRNNASTPVLTTFTAYGNSGTTICSNTFTVPANGMTTFGVSGPAPGCGTGVGFGSAQIAHHGPPGSLTANITSFSAVSGLSFDAPFRPRNMWSSLGTR